MAGDASQMSRVKHYLSCFPAPPLALDSARPTTIGRAEDNTIVLADSTVSRRHAVVEWRDGDFVVRDAGSQNGVFLNGERVEDAKLTSDDRIRIGDRVFTYFAGEERAVTQAFLKRRRKRQTGGTDIIDAAALAKRSEGFAGNLKDFALAELLQALDLGRKTGRVSVESEDLRGEMLLSDGRVVGCSVGGLEGEDAAYAMLSLKEGAFGFETCEVEIKGGLAGSTASLLMEALRRIDEERRASTEAAEGAEAGKGDAGEPEPHDPSLDTKHDEEPPPEVAAVAPRSPLEDTMVVRRPSALAEDGAPPGEATDSPASREAPQEEAAAQDSLPSPSKEAPAEVDAPEEPKDAADSGEASQEEAAAQDSSPAPSEEAPAKADTLEEPKDAADSGNEAGDSAEGAKDVHGHGT